ncbi:MAG: glycosyltransferase family 4 protein, partial [Oleispira sp.]|nr:glycosyltransferase family 4 protein [Oleispira sp.]
NFDIKRKHTSGNLLFLARIEKEKGIYIALDTFRILLRQYPKLLLTIAGDGSELLKAKEYVQKNEIPNIIFTGRISGDALQNAFKNNSFYLFPTYYGEGMPTSTLEAMAFGQIIISRPVGGIKDFFEYEKMGFILDSMKPIDFAEKISDLIKNEDEIIKISNYNYHYARNNFMASIVAQKIEHSIKKIII